MKLNSNILILLFLLLFLHKNVSAQKHTDTLEAKSFKHGLGVGAGFTTGYGLSYRFLPEQIGVQICFAPYKSDYTTQYSLGLTFLFKIIETEYTNLFIYQGNHFFYTKEKYDNYIYSYPSYTITPTQFVNKYWNNGMGIGIEFIILKRVSFNLMGGYAGYENFKNVGITGETGLYFRF
ncbi:MAG: hypothetical protein ACOYO1_09395 [Bacteroidales bacterium]